MKRISAIIIFIALTLSFAYAGELKPFLYTFNGKWQPSRDPLLIDDNGFQDIQNMRKDGNRLKGVSGHAKINTTVLGGSTYKYPKNGFQFKTDLHPETHTLVYTTSSATSGSGTGRLYDNVTAVPSAGDFETSSLHTFTSSPNIARFSKAPQNSVVVCNGKESLIWSGNEAVPLAFVVYGASTTAYDYTEQIQNTLTDSNNVATITAYSGGGYFYIGYSRPIQGFKVYVGTANTSSSTMTVNYWSGTSWTSVSGLSDGTDNGASLAQTGEVSFTSTAGLAKPRFFQGVHLYWYQVEIDAISSDVTVYHCTVDAPIQDVPNIWDGTESSVTACYVYSTTASTYEDHTIYSQDNDPTTLFDLDSLTAIYSYLVLGFTEPQQGFNIRVVAEKENSSASTLSVYYWNGSGWSSASVLHDGTKQSSVSLAKSGTITINPVGKGNEFTREIEQEVPLYYYKLVWSADLDSEVELYYITGIPNPQAISSYEFPAMFQNRTFLLNEYNGHKNKAIYSASNAPYIYNGSDSGELYFGNEADLTAACVIYNVFQTTGYEQLIVTKTDETYRVTGDGPDNWEVQQMSGNVGCIAPLSMVVCEVSDLEGEETRRHVAIWQSSSGVVMCDGASIIPISDDIKNYWDPNSADYIPASRQDDSYGWYDPDLKVYKLLISSGSGQTTHNVELEYSLKYNEWTKIFRENSSGANPLQCAFQVQDTNGKTYTYGGTNEGYVYRLEYGNTWNGTAISEYVQTKDILLTDEMMTHTTIKYLRLLYENKSSTSTISIVHYGDRVLSLTGTDGEDVPDAIDLDEGPINTQSCILGPSLIHSIRLSTSISDVADGMELIGLGFYFDPYLKIRED